MVTRALQLVGGILTVALLAAVSPAVAAAFTAHGSVQQVYVLGARPRQRLVLANRRGHVVRTTTAGPLGGAIFRGVAPGRGYSVGLLPSRGTGWAPVQTRLTVMPDRSAPPSTRIYD